MVETIVEFELFPSQKPAISDPSFAYSAVWITAQLKAYDVASSVIMATPVSEQKQLTTAKIKSVEASQQSFDYSVVVLVIFSYA